MSHQREWISQDALRRIEAEVQTKGPAIVRRARLVRNVERTLGAIGAVAIASWLAFTLAPKAEPPQIAGEQIAASKPCSLRGAPKVASDQQGGATAFVVGTIANAVLEPGSRGSIEEATACRTVLALEHGRITVEAHDLGGGELIVVAGDRRVTVHGTIFSVERTDRRFAVEVKEGVVSVSGHAKRLKAGDKLEEPIEFAKLETEEPDRDEEPKAKKKRQKKRAKRRARTSKTFDLDLDLDLDDEPEPEIEDEIDEAPEPRTPAPRTVQKTVQKIARPKPPEASPDDLVRIAGRLRHAGDIAGARELYRRAGSLDGPTAEAAWIALARLELELSRGSAAVDVLREHSRRFSSGSLVVEASWLRVQAYQLAGDRSAAEREARMLIRRWPSSEQARSAKAWLERSD